MELTPNDIRNTEFQSGFRGYEKEPVDAFRDAVATALEQARTEIAKKADDYDRLKKKYDDLKDMEDTVKSAVLEAQKNANQIVANAKKEAELMITEAKQKRDAIIEERHRRLADVEAKIEELDFTRNSFYNKLRGEIEAHLKLVNSISPAKDEANQMPQEPEIDEKSDDFADPLAHEPNPDEYKAEKVSPDAPPEGFTNDTMPSEIGDDTGPVEQQPEQFDSAPPEEPKRPTLELDDNEIDKLVDGFQEEVEKHTEEVVDGQAQREDI